MHLSSLTLEGLQIDCAYILLRLGEINLGYREDITLLGRFLVICGAHPCIHPSRVVCKSALSAARLRLMEKLEEKMQETVRKNVLCALC